MPVQQAVELRKRLRRGAYGFRVVKNRLALRALGDDGPAELRELLQRPTAIAFAERDPIGLAKLLQEFAAGGKVLQVKGGIVEGRFMPAERFDEVVRLTSRESLLGKIGFLMAAPLRNFMSALRAPLANTGLLMGQLKGKKET